MNIEMLHYFRYVAQYKNITSAAQHLYISQPTLSRHIMALEEELGVKLFERHNKQMRLTQAGQVFYKDSESFMKHMQTLINNVQAAGKGDTGILRITLPAVLHDALKEPIAAMKAQYPSVQIILEAYNFNEISNAVRHNLYDAGITYDFASIQDENGAFEGMSVLPLRKEKFCLLVPAKYGHFDAKQAMQAMVDVIPLIQPSHIEPPFLKSLLSELQSYTQTKIIQNFKLNTTESALMNVASGLGYSVVPDSWASFYANSKKVAFIDLSEIPQAQCTVVLVYNEVGATKAASNFVKLMDNWRLQDK